MEPDASADYELFLTDYLLNFEENSRDAGYFEGSSGVECHSDNENCSLASLKKSLEQTKKSSRVTGKFPTGSGKNKERGKGVDSNVEVGEEAARCSSNGQIILDPEDRRERERVRCVNYRIQRAERIKRLEKDSVELTESNRVLSDKNQALNERISALEDQVEYLERVLVNESSLSSILNTITEHSGLKIQGNSLLNSQKRKRQDIDDENAMTAKKNNYSASPKSGGVCLHLAPGRVSLEFCQECHKSSSTKDENE